MSIIVSCDREETAAKGKRDKDRLRSSLAGRHVQRHQSGIVGYVQVGVGSKDAPELIYVVVAGSGVRKSPRHLKTWCVALFS